MMRVFQRMFRECQWQEPGKKRRYTTGTLQRVLLKFNQGTLDVLSKLLTVQDRNVSNVCLLLVQKKA